MSLMPHLTPLESRRLRYDYLRDRYAALYVEQQFVKTELNALETQMIELGELEEGDIA